MTVGTKNYIYDYDYEKDVISLYAIEHSEGNLMQVRKVQNIKVFPNPVSAGQTLHFQLPEGSITGVNIYNAAGATELRAVGKDDTIEVPSEKLSTGVHPYKVTDDKGTTHSGKLIVK